MTDLPLHKISETNTTITLGWTPVAGARGYIFNANGKQSHTLDGARSQVKFAKPGPYKVEALGNLATGVYPPVVPPDPPSQTTMTPAQFQAACTPGATLRDITVTAGWVTIINPRVTLENVSLDVIQVMSRADEFSWVGGGGRAFYQRGAKGCWWEALKMDGQNRTSNCQLWGWTDGILPSYEIHRCEFKNYFNSDPGAHTEGVYMGSCERGILADSLFDHNGGPGPEHGTGHILIEAYGDTWSDKGYYCVRGNTFGQTDAYFSTQVKEVFTLASRVYIEPGQPTIKPLCQLPQFVRPCQ